MPALVVPGSGRARSRHRKAVLQMTDSTIPKNSGCFRPIRVLAEPGTVVNVNFPGPSVGATPRPIAVSPMS
jgi:N-methylhydantoinase B/oxoprolinase/acetone carboxylase alpha subunit